MSTMRPGKLYFGDNLKVLRNRDDGNFRDESFDLVYLDPPFNSNRDYNVLFQERDLSASRAQIKAFEDYWHWDEDAQSTYDELTGPEAPSHGVPPAVSILFDALYRSMPKRNDLLAYLVMMAPRLIELRRVLKPTGSLYLHCDPTASHYLKLVLDAIFGPANFRNEIIWKRTTVHNDSKTWSRVSDTLLFYTKGTRFTWNPQHQAHSQSYIDSKYRNRDAKGRAYQLDNMTSPNPRPNLTYVWMGFAPPVNGWRYSKETMQRLHDEGRIWYPAEKSKRPRLIRYLDEQKGPVCSNIWTDIDPVNAMAAERLGYPTQKPVALLERILKASTNPGDIVLDPFCGCGTTIEAAQKLGREWVGIDITHLAIQVIRDRLGNMTPSVSYELLGEPQDVESARVLAETSPYQFQWWAVHRVRAHPAGGQPGSREGKKGSDRGVDGFLKFRSNGAVHEAIISVKGGRNITPAMVRELRGTIARANAEIGVLITMQDPTNEMRREALAAGFFRPAGSSRKYPRIQLLPVSEIFEGKGIDCPGLDEPLTPADGHTLFLPGFERPPPPPRRGVHITAHSEPAEVTPLIPNDGLRKGPRHAPRSDIKREQKPSRTKK